MAELVLSAPGKNALSSAHMESLREQLRTAGGEPLLVTGAGDAFSAGLNLKEVAALDRAGMEGFLGTLEDLIEALFTYPGPTVACVNGHAIAGGCVLALCCDHRVIAADPKIRMGLNEVALGLQFPPKLLGAVRHRVPPRTLERVILEAGLHDPPAAHALGLVDEVAADAAAVARRRLAALAAHPREAYVATKRTLRAGALAITAEAERRFREELVPAWVTLAVKERVAAVLARSR